MARSLASVLFGSMKAKSQRTERLGGWVGGWGPYGGPVDILFMSLISPLQQSCQNLMFYLRSNALAFQILFALFAFLPY